MPIKVAVIGAGISGASSAYAILSYVPDAEVTITAEKHGKDITSDVAAGFWHPHKVANTPQQLVKRWSEMTWEHLDKLHMSAECGDAGVSLISGYHLYKIEEPIPEQDWQRTVRGHRAITQDELSKYPGHKQGWFFTSFVAEPAVYIPWLIKKFKSRGGRFIHKRVNTLDELSDDYDIIVNCTGVEAFHFVQDKDVHPSRGQLIKVKAPWIKHFVISEGESAYVIPVSSGLTVMGGTYNMGSWDRNPNEADGNRIMEDCFQLIPSLKTAEVVGHSVGIRPGRSRVRLELEYKKKVNKTYPVIHNYGHGGSGITLHWGCAMDTTELVKQYITDTKSKM